MGHVEFPVLNLLLYEAFFFVAEISLGSPI